MKFNRRSINLFDKSYTYFHIDEFSRDAIVASALKKKLKENAQDLVLKVSSITTSNWNFTTLDDKLFAIKEAGYNVGLSENAINIAIEAIRQVNDNDKVVKN